MYELFAPTAVISKRSKEIEAQRCLEQQPYRCTGG